MTMLVLSRTRGTAITLGDDIEIEIVAISGNQVKIGIRAPQEVEILRSELKQRPTHESPGLRTSMGEDPQIRTAR
jgi:carbon storage regulator